MTHGTGNPGKICAALVVAASLVALVAPAAAQRSPDRIIKRMDADGDGKVSADEFSGRRMPFSKIDTDGDGFATRAEIATAFGAKGGKQGRRGGGNIRALGGVSRDNLDEITLAAFMRNRVREHEIARGLLESELISVFPENLSCPEVDHVFGEDWQGNSRLGRSGSGRQHHGADIPAQDGTPILAVADGVVIAKYNGETNGYRGFEIVIQHAPDDTGLPVWVYTAYSHFSEMPKVSIGQKVRMGQPLGPTGKSGIENTPREEHLHIGVLYGESRKFVALRGRIVPVGGHYMDIVTLMRRRMPLDTNAMAALPKAERRVTIPHRLTTGATVPADTKIIWPFACRPD